LEAAMFYKTVDSGYTEVLKGVRYKTLVHGDRTSLTEFKLDQGSVVPTHQHPHEQTGYLISGKLRFEISGKSIEAESGDSWCIPANISHSAEAMEDSLLIEVFSPVREEYISKP
jgi:quercetin dioxygenase-like cupin family protein